MTIFKNSQFRSLWTAHTVALMGTNTGLVVLPLLALSTTHASVFQMSMLEAAESLAVLLFGIFIGKWADILQGRRAIIVANLLRAVVLASIPIAYFLGALSFPQIFCVVFIIGVGSLLYEAALSSMVVQEFSKPLWHRINAATQGSSEVTEIAGPGLGGILVQTIGAPLAVFTDVIMYLTSAVIYAFRPTPKTSTKPKDIDEPPHKLFDGLTLVWHSPALRAIVLSAANFNFFCAALSGLLIYFMVNDLGFSASMVGFSSIGAGLLGVAASMLTSSLMTRISTTFLYAMSYILAGCAAFLIPLALLAPSRTVAFIMVTLALGFWSFGIVVNVIMSETIKQLRSAPQRIGQVSSAIRWITLGVQPFGALAGGFIAKETSTALGLVLAAVGLVSSALWLFVGGNIHSVNLQKELAEEQN